MKPKLGKVIPLMENKYKYEIHKNSNIIRE